MTPFASTHNPLLDTDSFKASHWRQYPPDCQALFSYIEARGGSGEYARLVFFGLQALLQTNLSTPITQAMVDEARQVFEAHGQAFNGAGWQHIVDHWGGYLPLRIRALDEGTVVPARQILMTIESTDPACSWLVSYVETWLLRVWYPVTVATQSWTIRQIISDFLQKTADDEASLLPFMLHDFGSRGTTSREAAALGGCAHLVSFMSTDSVAALLCARQHYAEPAAGLSMPAAEHSCITSWGREGELEAYRNMVQHYASPGKRFSVVSDSYDLWQALELWGTRLREEVIRSGALLLVRPDSGNPAPVVLRTAAELEKHFGSTTNSRGYRVLNHVRILQADGVNRHTIREILANLALYGFSSENVCFGIGGALLQQMNRDTLGFAMKCSAIRRGDGWQAVSKDPSTDPGKRSRQGRLSLFQHRHSGEWQTLVIDEHGQPQVDEPQAWCDQLQVVYENGRLLRPQTLAQIRERAEQTRGLPNAGRIGSQGFLLF